LLPITLYNMINTADIVLPDAIRETGNGGDGKNSESPGPVRKDGKKGSVLGN
jgi:hypothetical protein